ncbi:hypothetical protein [Actinoplanes subglobosus]|uniref:Carbohydrate kinase PfkB domain-containing protein n=1 Tax=Actinoplanes subglobosus TaxID=1547892 RepID=A0ABV8ITB2_9ACTN
MALPRSPGSWHYAESPVTVQVGGAPLHACAGFEQAGFGSVVVSVVGGLATPGGDLGPDGLGAYLLSELDRRGQRHDVEVGTGCRTGRVVLLYPHDGGRVMVADAAGIAAMSPGHVDASIRRAAASHRHVVGSISGYLYFNDAADRIRRAAVSALRETGGLLWVDVVPHDLYTVLTFDEFRAAVTGLHFLSMDEETCGGFAAKAGVTETELLADLRELGIIVFLDRQGRVDRIGGREDRSVVHRPDAERTPGATDVTIAGEIARQAADLLGLRVLQPPRA